MPNSIYKKKYYTVYQITNKVTKEIYVGSHVTNKINDSYIGSGSELKRVYTNIGINPKKWTPNFDKYFYKEVLFVFNNYSEMSLKEEQIVNEEFVKRLDTYNIIPGGGGLNNSGMTTLKDSSNNIHHVRIDDPRYLSGELVGIAKGKVSVKDSLGKFSMISNKDPRYLSGELISVNKGMVVVKDNIGNIFKVYTTDERYINGELVSPNKGLKRSEEFIEYSRKRKNQLGLKRNNDGKKKMSEIHKNKSTFKNSEGSILYLDKDDLRVLSGEYVGIRKGITPSSIPKKGTTTIIHNLHLSKQKRHPIKEEIPEGWFKGSLKGKILYA